MKTRIDIVSGYYGAGKTDLISSMLGANLPNERITVYKAEIETEDTISIALVKLIKQYGPGRILFESTGKFLLSGLPAVFNDGALSNLAYSGTQAFVMDGCAYKSKHALLQGYYGSQIKHADVVFVNHTERLDIAGKLDVLGRIWEENHYVHLMVEPLHGIDLWRVFDLPAPNERSTAENSNR